MVGINPINPDLNGWVYSYRLYIGLWTGLVLRGTSSENPNFLMSNDGLRTTTYH